MKSLIAKHSVVIDGHKTSISLEDAFWNELKDIAQARRATVPQLLTEIDQTRTRGNLSSAIRLFVLEHFQNENTRVDVTDEHRASASAEEMQATQR